MRYTVTKKGCWNFDGPLDQGGYGKVSLKDASYRAHRLMAHITIKPLMSEDQLVAHKCDNPRCINPEHLFITTALGNMQDRDRKGRGFCGERVQWAKLKESDVRRIREKYEQGDSLSVIARDYPVTAGCIQAIVARRTWRHIV